MDSVWNFGSDNQTENEKPLCICQTDKGFSLILGSDGVFYINQDGQTELELFCLEYFARGEDFQIAIAQVFDRLPTIIQEQIVKFNHSLKVSTSINPPPRYMGGDIFSN